MLTPFFIDTLLTTVTQTASTIAIEKVFPEVLRDPILRKVQFSEVGRLDDLGMA